MSVRTLPIVAADRMRIEPADITLEQTSIYLETAVLPGSPAPRDDDDAPAGIDGRLVIQSVDRALTILEVLAASPEPMRLQDIAAATKLKVTTCYHLLNSLVVRGYAARKAQPRNYILGPKLLEVGRRASTSYDVTRLARPHLEALHERTGSTTCLASLQGTHLVLRDEISGPSSLSLGDYRNMLSRALHATALGKAILAWLPETQIARVVADNDLTSFTRQSIDNLGDLLESLRQIRRHGFSVEDRELKDNVVGIACAVRDRSGGVIGSIGCLLPAESTSYETLGEFRIEVAATARTISQLIN